MVCLLSVGGACASHDVPEFESRTTALGNESFLITLESTSHMSRLEMEQALLREAAKAAIDGGFLFLRVDELLTDRRLDIERSATSGGLAQPSGSTLPRTEGATGGKSRDTAASEISVTRRRNGSIRFAVEREKSAEPRTFAASELLDRLARGERVPLE